MGQRISDAAYRRATKLVELYLTQTKGRGEKTTALRVGAAIDEGFAPIRAALDEGTIDRHHDLVTTKTPEGWTSWFVQTLLKEGKACVENPSDYIPQARETLLSIMALWGDVNGAGKGGGKKGINSLGESDPLDEEFPLV